MATDFTAVVDASQVIRQLGIFQDQLPYAMAQALDLSLYAARKVVAADITQFFMLRNKFVPRSLKIDRPNKHKLWGRIGFMERAWFMESQVVGQPGRKHPKGKEIWMPLETGERAPRPNPAEAILNGRRPPKGAKGGDSGYFKVLKNISWPGIYYRESGEKKKLTAAYWLEPSMDVKARYPLDDRVIEAVGKAWPAAAVKACERALRTRK